MSEWISVKDRLPEKDGKYIVVKNYGVGKPYIDTAYFTNELELLLAFKYETDDIYKGAGWWDGDSEGDYVITAITHWMPMPELPKEE